MATIPGSSPLWNRTSSAFPIAWRELLVASKKPATFRSRWIIGLVFLLVAASMLWGFSRAPIGGMIGQQIFNSLTGILFLMALFSGMTTADALSSEKREGTLGLLFLTDMRTHHIVLGKLVAHSFASVVGLLGIVPFLSIAILLGGVGWMDVLVVCIALLNTIFFSMSLGLLISTNGREYQKMVGQFNVTLLVFWLGLPGLANLSRYNGMPDLARVIEWFSPAMQMSGIGTLGMARLFSDFWISILVCHVMGHIFLWSACLLLPHKWQEEPTLKSHSWRERWRTWQLGSAEKRTAYRKRFLEINPWIWLGSRVRTDAIYRYVIIILVIGITFSVYAMNKSLQLGYAFLIVAGIFHLMMRIMTAAVACKPLTEAHANGALEMLLSTPLKLQEIIKGQFLNVLRQMWILYFLTCLFSIAALWTLYSDDGDDIQIFFFVGTWICMTLDVLAITYLGLWTPLISKKPQQAAGIAVSRVLFVPWGIFASATLLLNLFDSVPQGMDFYEAYVSWVILNVFVALYFLRSAQRKFLAEARMKASLQFFQIEPESFWKRFLKWRNDVT
ncbi:MAG: ABC transporter permease subunit [Verrucomicrobiota bacterium]|nr:ABC transporter permease subunit [Verrucomicrobiota bacterium]